ncbi:MAG: hypothetical protein ABIV94_06895 [Acidimicrobiales bacterium]
MTGTRHRTDDCRGRAALDETERACLTVLVAALIGFGAYGFQTAAPSTVAYLFTTSMVATTLVWFRRTPLPPRLTAALTVLAVAHLAGGLVRVGDNVLYNAQLGLPAVEYDHFVHAGAVLAGCLVLWDLFGRALGERPPRELIVLCGLAALGLGAVNEVIEFLTTQVHHGTHVGGYDNTGWDLVCNLIGATIATARISKRHPAKLATDVDVAAA